jgi:tRNA threonylcarbamoyladenosine biosynthesis protein TsaB
MRVLALDTTTATGSVALVEDDRVILERGGDPSRTFAERLPADILTTLGTCAVTLSEVDVFAVACGPGSFTGLRIGIATVQGLAFVQNRGVVGISALEALAHLGSLEAGPAEAIAVWMDAHRHEVFSALYRVGAAPPFESGRLLELEGPAVGDPGATLARWADRPEMFPKTFIGDGAVLFRDMIRGVIIPPPLLAGAIGRIAIDRARQGDVVPAGGVRPLYVRRPDAEIARDQRPLGKPRDDGMTGR